MEIKNTIYCISGLGADELVFDQLKVEGFRLMPLKWLPARSGESLSSYAQRMWEQIPEENPLILGLSFGGMIGIEMARLKPVRKLIIISAPKTRRELPAWMRLTGRFRLHRVLPVRSNRYTEKADDRRMGIRTAEEKQLVEKYRRQADPKQVSWGIDQILRWQNNWVPQNTFHIHGEEDLMFPIKNLSVTHIIPDGTHIMILNRKREIEKCMEEILIS